MNASPIQHELKLHIEVTHFTKISIAKPTHESAAKVSSSLVETRSSIKTASSAKVIKTATKSVQSSLINLGRGSNLADASASATFPGALSPIQINTAYGVTAYNKAQLAANSSYKPGLGVTVEILEELNDPDLPADIAAFSTQYGLPQMDGLSVNGVKDPTFTQVNDTALGSVGSGIGSTSEEAALDLEMVHEIAPYASIIMVDTPGNGNAATQISNLSKGALYATTLTTTTTTPIVALSMSYGENDASSETANDTYYQQISAKGIAVAISAGDSGVTSYPAASDYVTAVGGTSLYLSSVKGNYGYETAWGGLTGAGAGGGGVSKYETTPTFQSSNGVTSANGVTLTKRATPDVSLVADPETGVSVYDSADATANGGAWTVVGGTSAAAPLFAGMEALMQQGRIANGLSTLNSVQIDSLMYDTYTSPSLYAQTFHDVTLGNNNNVSSSGTVSTHFAATTGYDLATGLGSPIANVLIPYIANATTGFATGPVTGKPGSGNGGTFVGGGA